jgi:hypothetical protein
MSDQTGDQPGQRDDHGPPTPGGYGRRAGGSINRAPAFPLRPEEGLRGTGRHRALGASARSRPQRGLSPPSRVTIPGAGYFRFQVFRGVPPHPVKDWTRSATGGIPIFPRLRSGVQDGCAALLVGDPPPHGRSSDRMSPAHCRSG